MSNKLKPALIGGVIVGLLSAIVSQIPIVSTCCCVWGIAGGAVAGLMYVKGSPTRVSVGDGAIVGALAGVIGALIYLVIALPIALYLGSAAIEEQLARTGVHMPLPGAALIVVGAILAGICLIILATVGGLVAIPIFEKRKDPMPPQPPSTGGGGYAA
ncbi:MAG TPA: hypothetical protein VJ372_04990 [Pyrinomonadaceae bacterium]|jgi:hypothetical protein|nr:hypothetical protein [Pyrinomonadaceae bacterium]